MRGGAEKGDLERVVRAVQKRGESKEKEKKRERRSPVWKPVISGRWTEAPLYHRSNAERRGWMTAFCRREKKPKLGWFHTQLYRHPHCMHNASPYPILRLSPTHTPTHLDHPSGCVLTWWCRVELDAWTAGRIISRSECVLDDLRHHRVGTPALLFGYVQPCFGIVQLQRVFSARCEQNY